MSTLILGVDPGQNTHGMALWCPETNRLIRSSSAATSKDVDETIALGHDQIECLVIEGMQSRSSFFKNKAGEMVPQFVGASVHDTSEWIGWFRRGAYEFGIPSYKYYRTQLGSWFAGSPKTEAKIIRDVLYRRFGGKGIKKDPGPFYGLAGDHALMAVAYAIMCADKFAGKLTGMYEGEGDGLPLLKPIKGVVADLA